MTQLACVADEVLGDAAAGVAMCVVAPARGGDSLFGRLTDRREGDRDL